MEILLNFEDLKQGEKALKKLRQAFTRAGAPVASADVDTKVRRTSGRTFRQVQMTFTDNQTIVFMVSQSGDIFQVKLNGSMIPIKNQGDHKKAVAELVSALDKGRAKFQAKLARARVALPRSIKTAAPKLEVQLKAASEELDARIAAAETQLAELKASRGVVDSVQCGPDQEQGQTLDSAAPEKRGYYVRFKDGDSPRFLGESIGAAKRGYEKWAESKDGEKIIDKEVATRKSLHWVEFYYGLDVRGNQAWANVNKTDLMLDSAPPEANEDADPDLQGSDVLDAAVRQVVEIKQGNSFVYRAMEPQDFLRRVEKLAKKRPKTLPEAVEKFNELNEDKQTAKVVAQQKKMGRWITIMGGTPSATAPEDNADYFAFQVEGARSMTIVVKVKPGSTEADAKKSAVNAAEKSALGEGSTGLKSGKKLSKLPSSAVEIAGAKGWAWLIKGHPVLDGAAASLATAIINGEVYDDLSVAEHIIRQEMEKADDKAALQEVLDCIKTMREDTGATLDAVPNLPEFAQGVSLDAVVDLLEMSEEGDYQKALEVLKSKTP